MNLKEYLQREKDVLACLPTSRHEAITRAAINYRLGVHGDRQLSDKLTDILRSSEKIGTIRTNKVAGKAYVSIKPRTCYFKIG